MRHTEPASRGEPPIPKVPGLGISWYRRGASYWIRRALICVFFTAMLFIISLLVFGVFKWIFSRDIVWVRVVLLCLAFGALALSMFRGFRALNMVRRGQRDGIHISLTDAYKPGSLLAKQSNGRSVALASTGAAAGAGAAAGNDALGGILALAAVFVYGDLLAFGLTMFLKYTPPEHVAVLALEKWKAEHPDWTDER